MSRDGRGLRRLHLLYQGVEAMRLLELQVAAQGLAEARGARELELLAARMAGAGQRRALATGGGEDRLLAEGAERLAGARAARLEGLCAEREDQLAEALAAHAGSRMDAEGIGRVLDRIRSAAALEGGRRQQAASDDRFGARRAWVERDERERKALGAGRAAAVPAGTGSVATEAVDTSPLVAYRPAPRGEGTDPAASELITSQTVTLGATAADLGITVPGERSSCPETGRDI